MPGYLSSYHAATDLDFFFLSHCTSWCPTAYRAICAEEGQTHLRAPSAPSPGRRHSRAKPPGECGAARACGRGPHGPRAVETPGANDEDNGVNIALDPNLLEIALTVGRGLPGCSGLGKHPAQGRSGGRVLGSLGGEGFKGVNGEPSCHLFQRSSSRHGRGRVDAVEADESNEG